MTLLQGRLEKSASTRVIPFLWQDKCQMIGGKDLWEVKKVLSRTSTSCSEWSKSYYLVYHEIIEIIAMNKEFDNNDLSGFQKVSYLKFEVKLCLIRKFFKQDKLLWDLQVLIKVKLSQNKYMKPLIFQEANQKIWRILPYVLQGKNP